MKVGENVLSYISVDIYNNQYKAGIQLDSTVLANSLGDVDTIEISRKRYNGSSWTKIYTISVEELSDMGFHLLDITALCGTAYSYTIDIKDGTTLIESQIYDNIKCDFEGMFVGNFSDYYIAVANCSTSTKRNTQVAYVNTLTGRLPYRVSNAQTNYTTGQSEGLFLHLTSDKKKFVPDEYTEYATAVIDFLTDGTEKIIKTNDGQIWFTSIDQAVTLPSNENYRGYYPISFTWTEIGDIPISGMVVENAE